MPPPIGVVRHVSSQSAKGHYEAFFIYGCSRIMSNNASSMITQLLSFKKIKQKIILGSF
ncbi:hypothetical protein HanIR_Chr12g0580031 [Helianthus annuus]|nr:hypothetical protein HanIR_Chr12g0580031 [Helianthus annuus]